MSRVASKFRSQRLLKGGMAIALLVGITTPIALALALIGGYSAYELALLAATPFLGSADNFTAAIVGRIGVLNIAWLIGLVAACEIVRLVNPFKRGHIVS